MKSHALLVDLAFREAAPYAQPLLVDQHTRILRWMLKPGQQIDKHKVPNLPFYVLILSGHGLFAGEDGVEMEYGPASLLLFDPNETHSVRALDEELIFVSFLNSVAGMRADRVGGEIGSHSRSDN